MATQALKCERHGELTRLTCVDCGKPICPKCAVRTEVGLKCEEDAAPAAIPEKALAMMRPSRRPLYLGIAGAAIVLVLIVVLVLSRSDTKEKPAPALPPVGTWRQAPDLATIRGTATAVVLKNGKALVAGGGVGAVVINSAEIFDAASGTWSTTAPMSIGRIGHSLTVLADGRVLAAGGSSRGQGGAGG